MSYSVLFRQPPVDQFDALAPAVRQAYGITDFDARAKIRRGWGFLERNATAEDARDRSDQGWSERLFVATHLAFRRRSQE